MGDSIQAFVDETEVIGQERDIVANLDSGTGMVDVSINPFGTRPTLQYNSQVAVTGSGTIIWDGVDNDATTISLGLNGRDLTQQNTLNGIALRIGASAAGAQARVRVYEGGIGNFSEATLSIPLTAGGAADSYEFIPFTNFSGPVSEADVDAITLTLDSNSTQANNIELAAIGVNGPRVVDFLNTPVTDLAISKTNQVAVVVPGEAVQYTLQVDNNGPSDAFGATIVDDLPNELNSVTYTSQVIGNATGNTESGTGNINDTVFIEANSSIVYTVDGIVNPGVVGSLSNTATVGVPNGVDDPNLLNNHSNRLRSPSARSRFDDLERQRPHVGCTWRAGDLYGGGYQCRPESGGRCVGGRQHSRGIDQRHLPKRCAGNGGWKHERIR